LADCLAACASMLIAYAGRSVDYRQLLELLQIGPLGTLRRHVFALDAPRFSSDVSRSHPAAAGRLSSGQAAGHRLCRYRRTALLVIDHQSAVVVGTTEDQILVNDPAFDAAPLSIPIGNFELAWLNCDNACALIDVIN